MNTSDLVAEFRMHWCNILEEYLECPVCLDIPVDLKVYMCVNGHNVCNICKKELDSCPVCKSAFGDGIRNRSVEELSKKFEEMKSSLLDPNSDYMKSKIEKVDAGLQTDVCPEEKSTDGDTNKKDKSTQTSSTEAFSSGCKTPRRSSRNQLKRR